jgi:hypothetical protein
MQASRDPLARAEDIVEREQRRYDNRPEAASQTGISRPAKTLCSQSLEFAPSSPMPLMSVNERRNLCLLAGVP